MSRGHRLALLVTGASGMALPRHLLAAMARRHDVERVHLVVSRGASQVLKHELGASSTGAADLVAASGIADVDTDGDGDGDGSVDGAAAKIEIHKDSAIDAPIASGSHRLTGTAVVPLSAGTLGAFATGSARTLVHRAGAVALKEGWPFVLGFRETPLSVVHLENLRRLAYQGAVILPPIPAFYIDDPSMERFLDHYAMRVLDGLGLPASRDADLRWS